MPILLIDHVDARPSGLLTLRIYRRGELLEEEGHNLVVDNYKQIHARMLGGDVTNRSIVKIGFGISSAAPAPGNTSLTSAFVKAVDSVSYPASNRVQFNFSLGTDEANGKAIMEFGLLTGSDLLYARKTRSSALNKESDISLTGSWRIDF